MLHVILSDTLSHYFSTQDLRLSALIQRDINSIFIGILLDTSQVIYFHLIFRVLFGPGPVCSSCYIIIIIQSQTGGQISSETHVKSWKSAGAKMKCPHAAQGQLKAYILQTKAGNLFYWRQQPENRKRNVRQAPPDSLQHSVSYSRWRQCCLKVCELRRLIYRSTREKLGCFVNLRLQSGGCTLA